jgi:hypothetical protein
MRFFLIKVLNRSGFSPCGLTDAHACLEANRDGWNDVMAMGTMDAEVIAYLAAGNYF